MRALIDASPAAIIEVDEAGLVREWNPAAAGLFGCERAEVWGQALPDAAVGRLLEGELEAHRDDPARSGSVHELTVRRRDGRALTLEVSVAATRAGDGAVHGVMGLLIDISERARLERRLSHQAEHDTLTGLPNRELLNRRLEEALAADRVSGAHTGLLVVNVDRFKEINDTLGHGCGDQVLAQIGPRLIAAAVRGDDMVARLGGDEFAVLMPGLENLDEGAQVAELVLAILQSPFSVRPSSGEATTVDVAVSVGMAVAPLHGERPAALLRHADAAMSEAKEAASGLAVFAGNRRAGGPSGFEVLGGLRRALERNELVVHYQPKFDLRTNRLHSLEALVRWEHPERGLLGPGQFMPVAEATGLIHPLTDRVIELVLQRVRAWTREGLRVPVAVNLSARCLHGRSLPERVTAALAEHGVPVDLLSLEITESAIMRDPEAALGLLDTFTAAGIHLSLDDFGTGYSSMAYLRRLPVSELKIDRSFITGLLTERADTILVRSIINLGHNLGLHVVAEGIEDRATVEVLRQLECDVLQGFFIARPMPGEQVERWLSEFRLPEPDAPGRPALPGHGGVNERRDGVAHHGDPPTNLY